MIASAISSQTGSPTIATIALTARSNPRLTTQSAPAKTGGRSSKSGMPWPGHVLAPPLDEELGRTRSDAHLHSAPVSLLDDLDELAVVEVGVGDDQLVDVVLRQHGRERREVAEHAQARAVRRRGDRADEVVVDPATAGAQRAVEPSKALSGADEDGAPPDAGELEEVAGDDVIAAARAGR